MSVTFVSTAAAGPLRRRASRAPMARYGVALIVTALAIGTVVSTDIESSIAAKIIIGSIAVIVLSIVAATTATTSSERRDRSSIMFGVLYPVYFGLIFGWTTFAWLSDNPANALVDRSEIPAALPVVMIGLVGWWIGYKLGSFPTLERIARRTGNLFAAAASLDVATSRIVVTYAIATVARLFLVVRGSYGYLADATESYSSASTVDQFAMIISGFAPLALLLLAIGYFRHGRRSAPRAIPLLIAVLLEVGFTAFSGQKNPFFLMGISLLIAGVAVGRLSWHSLLVAASVGILLIFPFNAKYRDLLRPVPGQQADSSQATSLFVTAAKDTVGDLANPGQYIGDALESVSDRLRSIDGVAVSVHKHRTELPYQPPSAVIRRAMVLSVPRLLWPSKPVDNYPLEITRDYYDLPDYVYTSSTLTVVGDAYRYGGRVMVFSGLIWLGIVCRFIDVAFDSRRASLLLVGFVAAITIIPSSTISTLIVGFARTYILLILLMWFLEGRQRRIVTG